MSLTAVEERKASMVAVTIESARLKLLSSSSIWKPRPDLSLTFDSFPSAFSQSWGFSFTNMGLALSSLPLSVVVVFAVVVVGVLISMMTDGLVTLALDSGMTNKV